MTKNIVDITIYRLHIKGSSIRDIKEHLNIQSLKHRDIAKSIAMSEMTIDFNRVEFNDNYLIIPSLMNYDFTLK